MLITYQNTVMLQHRMFSLPNKLSYQESVAPQQHLPVSWENTEIRCVAIAMLISGAAVAQGQSQRCAAGRWFNSPSLHVKPKTVPNVLVSMAATSISV